MRRMSHTNRSDPRIHRNSPAQQEADQTQTQKTASPCRWSVGSDAWSRAGRVWGSRWMTSESHATNRTPTKPGNGGGRELRPWIF